MKQKFAKLIDVKSIVTLVMTFAMILILTGVLFLSFLAIFAFIGVVIGVFGSVISLNKYLKEHNNVVESD